MTTAPAPASAPTADKPLDADDFDWLDAELDAMREQDEFTPDWEFCEGFLAALVCTRRAVPPEEYWPVLFGEDFRPMEHMEFVWRWRRRWREVEQALDADVEQLQDERAYNPEVLDTLGALLALPEEERGDSDLEQLPSFAQSWAEGFLEVVRAWPDDWAPPRDKEQSRIRAESLSTIELLAATDTGEAALNLHTEDGPPSVSQQRLEDFHAAIWATYDLRSLWKSLGPRIDPIRKAEGPGRNDPCSCGSGKKFKKCCGA